MDMELIEEQYKPNFLLIPIGDRFTMGPEGAALACKKFFKKTSGRVSKVTLRLSCGSIIMSTFSTQILNIQFWKHQMPSAILIQTAKVEEVKCSC